MVLWLLYKTIGMLTRSLEIGLFQRKTHQSLSRLIRIVTRKPHPKVVFGASLEATLVPV